MNGWCAEVYGTSLRGAELHVLLPPRPEALLLAGVHGEEPETVVLARGVVERVPAAATRFAVVLCANPDGVAAGTRQNARGVDLNRNWPASTWSQRTSYSYPPGIDPARRVQGNRSNASSAGECPLSEPESAHLAELVERLGVGLVVDLHSPLELVLTASDSAETLAAALAAAADLPLHDELGAPTPGSMRDWLVERGTGSIVYEVEHGPLPALFARHVPALERLLRDELSM